VGSASSAYAEFNGELMKDVQKPDHVSLTTLIGRLREGQYVIPDFQREFEWKPWDIQELIRSIFLDYYIGSLLLWKGKTETFEALACEPIYGFSGDGDPAHIVLDGQQRLTAMYYAFMAPDVPAPSRSNRFLYFIRVDRFMEEAYDEAFEYDWTRRGVNLLTEQNAQFETHMFPLAIIGRGGWELPNWVQGYEKFWRDREAAARTSGDDAEAHAASRQAEYARTFGLALRRLGSATGEPIRTSEPHTHTVPHGDRSAVVIEPFLTDQWYVDANRAPLRR
jgi:hypothetical protein